MYLEGKETIVTNERTLNCLNDSLGARGKRFRQLSKGQLLIAHKTNRKWDNLSLSLSLSPIPTSLSWLTYSLHSSVLSEKTESIRWRRHSKFRCKVRTAPVQIQGTTVANQEWLDPVWLSYSAAHWLMWPCWASVDLKLQFVEIDNFLLLRLILSKFLGLLNCSQPVAEVYLIHCTAVNPQEQMFHWQPLRKWIFFENCLN